MVVIERFVLGLGAVSNLNNGYPMGLWVVFDMVIGTAIGCGGFAMALVVYVMNRREYHPMMRPALLAGLFGYALGGFSIVVDLGRYMNMLNIFVPSLINPNSVLLEVALCVSVYVTVLAVEVSPAFLEGLGLGWLRKPLRKVMFIFIALGVLLPLMHQSSLGTLLTSLGYQLSPLWQTQTLPVIYLLTAIAMGLAIVMAKGALMAQGGTMEMGLLHRLAHLLRALLAVFLLIRFGDLIWRGALGLALAPEWKSFTFWLENGLFFAALAFIWPGARRSRHCPCRVLFSAISTLLGGAMLRLNSWLIGYTAAGADWRYYPSILELVVTLAVISFEVVAFLYLVKKFPVMPDFEHPTHA
ncbi:putative hydrogenase 2 b cytochrome subunit [Magnetofaba australis IT-1]|uniref:Putative hydrogenase 2 b cytochrome subunit n=1 Tax=Magnetofaba australis IT-1 TaxID=1434232 RepID=A0A1Y2K530_9PROT|nr:putative hydrogenase 2 b cytochrome subunit [Magnetofaba australis IT-1]